jgi:AcrR family transcriptional regulator
MTTAAPPELRSDALRNRDRVLEIARQHLAAGRTELPMNVIAREARLGVGTVYRHFPTRQSLLETVAADGFGDLVSLAQSAAGHDDPEKALRALLGGTLRCLDQKLGMAAVLESSEFACLETVQLAAGLMDAVQSVLLRARKAGLVRPGITTSDIRRLVLGFHHARALPGDDPGTPTAYLNVLLDGLRRQAR